MKVVLALMFGVLLLPAAAQARSSSYDGTDNAFSQCNALRVEIGQSTFGATFSSFDRCVSKLTPLDRQNTLAAETLCRDRFAARSRHASSVGFDQCIAAFAKSASVTEQPLLSPRHACASLRASSGSAAFTDRYGSGSPVDALRNCVSTTATAELAFELSSASSCRAEQETSGFASTHGGMTFARFYGTTPSDSNAFGRCVSLKAQARAASQAGRISAGVQGQQSVPQTSSTTSTTTTASSSIDGCSGGSALGKPNRLMPSDCVPAAPSP
jgi:hypothetical protein